MWFLDQAARDRIHRGSLDLLATLGVRVDHGDVLDKLQGQGAKVDRMNNIARLPEKLVMEALSSAPSTAAIEDRRGGRHALRPGGDPVYWTGNALYMVEGTQRREISAKDFSRMAALVDHLDHVNAMVGTSIADVPPRCRDLVGFRLMAEQTTKHLRPVIFSAEGGNAILEMAQVLLDGRDLAEHPIFSLGYSNVSPLHWTNTALELMCFTSGRKIPMMLNAEPMAGGTSPVTIAGSILAGNAEILSGIVIAQLLEEGRPCIYNLGFAHVLDMRTTVALTGSPETSMFAVSGAEMAAYYHLPCASWASTDAIAMDSQAAYEKMLAFLTHTQAGVNMIWGVGQLEAQLSLSLSQAVIDNEIIGYVKRYQRGFGTEEEAFALDVIQQVGFSGDFLSHDHTLRHYREELSISDLAYRNRRGPWEAEGSKRIETRAEERVHALLSAEHVCVSPAQQRELREIEGAWRRQWS